MKITIELTENQVKGIKEYLKDTNGTDEKVTKQDIKTEILGIVHSCLQTGAVYDYIYKYENL